MHKEEKQMALMEVNFFSKALMRPITMNVILPADKVFFEEETEEDNKPFKTLYLLHGVMGNYTDWVTGTCIKRWAEEKNLAVVMPSGANMFYMDHPDANENYSEFIGKELVKITRRMFPLSHKKEDTFSILIICIIYYFISFQRLAALTGFQSS